MMKRNLRAFDILAATLLVAGGLNWGLIALFEIDLAASLAGLEFGSLGEPNRILYAMVGLAALYQTTTLPGLWRRWGITGEADQRS